MKKGSKHSEATKKKMSKALTGRPSPNKGIPCSEAQKAKISKAKKGVPAPGKTAKGLKRKPATGKAAAGVSRKPQTGKKAKGVPKTGKFAKGVPKTGKFAKGVSRKPLTPEHCKRVSATKQGIPYDEWEAFACEKTYCPKFNESCRESCRAKYNYRCFICDKPQSENKTKKGKVHKLSVHHVDMDKAQGCESNWKLVPLCKHCHATAHNDELVARLGYLINEVI